MSSSGSPSKNTKAYAYTSACPNIVKRSMDVETGKECMSKKLKIDISAGSGWNQKGAISKMKSKRPDLITSTALQSTQSKTLPVTMDNVLHDNSKLSTQNTLTQTTKNGEIVIIRNLSSQCLNEDAKFSEQPTTETTDKYVVLSSEVMEYVDPEDYIVTTSSEKSAPKAAAKSHSAEASTAVTDSASTIGGNATEGTSRKVGNESSSADTSELRKNFMPKDSQTNSVDEVEVVILPNVSDTKKSVETTASKTATITRTATMPTSTLLPHTTTGTSIIVSNAGFQSTNTVLSRVNVQPALKNQPSIMVTPKKLMSEVMQTTAKVSIGNTTISVPLLKPLNSKQLIQKGNFVGETQKQQLVAASQAQSAASPIQTQLSLSKILNVKRSNASNHPTIVSLSQLQIKPAKIVQAKVVGKKMQMPLQLQQLPTTTMSNQGNSSNILTICGSKQTKSNIIHNFGTKKSQLTFQTCPDMSTVPAAILEEDTDAVCIRATTAEHLRTTPHAESTHTEGNVNVDASQPLPVVSKEVLTAANTKASEPEEEMPNVTTIKKISTTVSNSVPPLYSTLTKYVGDQQGFKLQPQSINMSSAISIIKQNPQQLVATSAVLNVATSLTESNARIDSVAGKSASNGNSTKLTTSLMPFSRNTTLKLNKNEIGVGNQCPKSSALTVLNPAITAHSVIGGGSGSSSDHLTKKSNFQKSNVVITEVKNYGCGKLTSMAESNLVTSVISVGTQSHDATGGMQENADETQRRISKVPLSTNILSAVGNPLKQNKPVDENINQEASDITITSKTDGNTTSGDSHIISKPEETHNVLLKQLLQNSSTSHSINQSAPMTTASKSLPMPETSVSTICNQLSARKVTNVRAPCLGTVSSLEAQLARPVIPPVPANATGINTVKSDAAEKANVNSAEKQETKLSEPITAPQQKDFKVKSTATQMISKETSFVSNPTIDITPSDLKFRYSTSVNTSTTEKQPVTVVSPSATTSSPNNSAANRNLTITYAKLTTHEPKEMTQDKKIIYPIPNKMTTETTNAVSNRIACPTPIKPSSSISNRTSKQTSTDEVPQLKSSIISEENNKSSLKSNQPQSLVEKIATDAKPMEDKKPKIESNLSAISTPTTNQITKNVEHAQNTQLIMMPNKPSTPNKSSTSNKPPENTCEEKPSKLLTTTENIAQGSLAPESEVATKLQKGNEKLTQESKDAEFRKKRKREYQKQRRQLLNTNKELSPNTTVANSSNTKRKQRKISKVEEDYDSFIENLISRVRQMQPLQVQEPMLNKNFGIYGMHGKHISTRSDNNAKNEGQERNQTTEEFGYVRQWNSKALYDTKNGNKIKDQAKPLLYTIHNDFYDQEFLPIVFKNEHDKQLRLIRLIRERNVEPIDLVNRIQNNNANSKCSLNNYNENNASAMHMSYPGLILMNNDDTQYLGRMSPIIPTVVPNAKKVRFICNLKPLKEQNTEADEKQDYAKLSKLSEHLRTKEDSAGSQTVILSVSASSAINVFGIMRDLANLLGITPPATYKIIDAPSFYDSHQKRQFVHHHQYAKVQKLVCGGNNVCRVCAKTINGNGIQIPRTKALDSKFQMVQLSKRDVHFCSKTCFEQYDARRKQSLTDLKTKSAALELLPGADVNKEATKPSVQNDEQLNSVEEASAKKCRFRYFTNENLKQGPQLKPLSEKEMTDILFKMNITVTGPSYGTNSSDTTPTSRPLEDVRQCILCNQRGDGLADGSSRLLNFEVDKWVHLNCALWSNGVYETISGGLMNLQTALQVGLNQMCGSCQQFGATVKCFKNRCSAVFHLPCAIRKQCVFYKNKTIHCQQHASRTEKDSELTSLTVHRRVFVERDENRQVAAIMHHSELNNLLRVGGLTFLNVGQLLPHQLEAFHTSNYIYPIGYKVIRFYWSMKRPNKRCRYICSIAEVSGRPEFRIQVQDETNIDTEIRDISPKAVWQTILESVAELRKDSELVQLFPQFITGEDLYGLTEPAIVRIIESLPGVETLTDYRFKYGRNPLLELPLAINSSGAARTEPKQRHLLGWRKLHTQRTSTAFNQRTTNSVSLVVAGEIACPYSKQFVHSKSSQYKKMKQEWRNNVYLARSKIQGLGLYAARDIEKHTMIIEYIGEVIRTEVSEIREKQYEAKNRGIYMFRLDEDRVVDATLCGGLARYINHSCNPNCVTEIVDVDREVRIIIFAKRRINRGEELSYDYKFDIEDDANKIPCMCGAPNCRKWMN